MRYRYLQLDRAESAVGIETLADVVVVAAAAAVAVVGCAAVPAGPVKGGDATLIPPAESEVALEAAAIPHRSWWSRQGMFHHVYDLDHRRLPACSTTKRREDASSVSGRNSTQELPPR